MKKIISLLVVTLFSKILIAGIAITNNSQYEINCTIFAHRNGQECNKYQSASTLVLSTDGIGSVYDSYSSISPFWWLYTNGNTNQTIPAPSTIPIWDAVKFYYNSPTGIILGSVGSNCSGASTTFTSSYFTVNWVDYGNGNIFVTFN